MTFKLFINQFIRSKEVKISLFLIMLLGLVSIFIGKKHIVKQNQAINEVTSYQKKHFDRYVAAHNEDLGLLLYYVKFSFIHQSNPLSGFSIGQSDINPSIKRITIKTFEAQKYDTDLTNPMNLQSGNLDLSFVLIYLIPLLIIVMVFNVLSEETESGTWHLVAVQTKSKLSFLCNKLLVRFLFVETLVVMLFLIGALLLSISFSAQLVTLFLLATLYVVFWFSLSFFIALFKKSSGFNVLILLTIWLVILILIPSGINTYVSSKYPIPEALNTAIAQRDGYHTKWDTEESPTIKKFYDHYPEFEKYGYPTGGFNWLWYYAMQQMGDDDSKEEQQNLKAKIKLRLEATNKLTSVIPNMYLQRTFNKIAGTSMEEHLTYLEATGDFHEKLRLYFYPRIFENVYADTIDWNQFKPEFYRATSDIKPFKTVLPLILSTLFFILISIPKIRNL